MRRLDWLCAALLATIALAGLDSCFADEQTDAQGLLRDDVQRIVEEHRESREQFQNELSKVKGRAELDKIWQRKPGTIPQGNKIVAWAEQHPADPLAVESLGMIILRNAGSQESATARTVLLTQHLDLHGTEFETISLSVMEQSPLGETEKWLSAFMTDSPNRSTRGMACMELAGFKLALCENANKLKAPATAKAVEQELSPAEAGCLAKLDVEKCHQEAIALMQRVVDEFGDVTSTKGDVIASLAERFCFEDEHLKIGRVAPEIECPDLHGKDLKLSEFRGKVVVLVFWATWCGPCMKMVADERLLMEQNQGKPFTIIGVNIDNDVDVARDAATREKMTWPVWLDPDKSHIFEKWNVRKLPTVFVLDQRGVIRHKDIRGEILAQAVAELLTNTAR